MTDFSNGHRSRTPARLSFLLLAPTLLLTIPLVGCYQDTRGTYQAVADANGDLHRPGSPGSIEQIPMTADTHAKGKEVTPAPDLGTPGAADVGLPFYPAAKPRMGLDGLPRASREADGTVLIALDTDDPPDKVVAFYRNAIPNASYREDDRDGRHIQSLSREQDNFSNGVDISVENGKTSILLMRMPLLSKSNFDYSAQDTTAPAKSAPAKPGPKAPPVRPQGEIPSAATAPIAPASVLPPTTSPGNDTLSHPTPALPSRP